MPVKNAGFSLAEVLIALAISSLLLLGAARMLPLFGESSMQILQRRQLQQELQQLIITISKHIRRAGYCNGICSGEALQIRAEGSCLLMKWDGNHNGVWEGVTDPESDSYGFRLRESSIETQRGVEQCYGPGWERLTDPDLITITQLHFERDNSQIRISLSGFSTRFPFLSVRLEQAAFGNNL